MARRAIQNSRNFFAKKTSYATIEFEKIMVIYVHTLKISSRDSRRLRPLRL